MPYPQYVVMTNAESDVHCILYIDRELAFKLQRTQYQGLILLMELTFSVLCYRLIAMLVGSKYYYYFQDISLTHFACARSLSSVFSDSFPLMSFFCSSSFISFFCLSSSSTSYKKLIIESGLLSINATQTQPCSTDFHNYYKEWNLFNSYHSHNNYQLTAFSLFHSFCK